MSLSEVISQELASARNICSTYGDTDPHCRAAWDAVEEVLAARSHQHANLSNFERYCLDNPEAAECLIYDN